MSQRHGNSNRAASPVPSGEVTRKRYTEQPLMLTLKMEPDFMREIDDEVLRQSNLVGRILTRSDVVKDLLREALAARQQQKHTRKK